MKLSEVCVFSVVHCYVKALEQETNKQPEVSTQLPYERNSELSVCCVNIDLSHRTVFPLRPS